MDILKICFKRILLYGAEIWTTNREDTKNSSHGNEILESNLKQNKGLDKKYKHKIRIKNG